MSDEITHLDDKAFDAAIDTANQAAHAGLDNQEQLKSAILAYLNAIKGGKDAARQYIADNG